MASSIYSSGNITLDRATTFFLELKDDDGAGGFTDWSTADLRFQIRGKLSIVPGAHPDNSRWRLLKITTAQIVDLGKGPIDYHLAIVENGDSTVLLSGTISIEGFALAA